MNKVHFLDSQEIRINIENRILGMLNRVQSVTGQSIALSLKQVAEVGQSYAHMLGGHAGERHGVFAATTVRDQLLYFAEESSPDFWSTALGRAIAWWTGGPSYGMSRASATEALGVSRQYVHRLIRNGGLQLVTGDGVAPEDMVRLMRAKYPHEITEG